LLEILLLHLPPSVALFTCRALLWKEELIDDDTVRIYMVIIELLDHTFSLVEGEELRDADADEAVYLG
jgi:hypothetical protein